MLRALGLALFVFAVLFIARTPDADPEAMLAKYTDDVSAFADDDEGLKVHYRDEGPAGALPLILIHGTSASLHTWEPLVDRLENEYRVISYTQPGHGLTGPHPDRDYSFAGMAEALDLVYATTGVERAVLVGNSMGGWVAWRYALAHPDRVAGLVLIDAAGAPLREGEAPPPLNIGFKLIQNPVGRFLMRQYTPRAIVERSLLDTVEVDEIATPEMVDRYWELLRLPGNRQAAADRALAGREAEKFAEVGSIAAPTLIIWGAQDQLIYASAAQTFDEAMPNADVVIYDGIGHLPMEEAPDRTALDIDAFLERTVKAAALESILE